MTTWNNVTVGTSGETLFDSEDAGVRARTLMVRAKSGNSPLECWRQGIDDDEEDGIRIPADDQYHPIAFPVGSARQVLAAKGVGGDAESDGYVLVPGTN